MRTKNNFQIFLIIVSLAFFGCSETEIDVPQIEAKVVGKGEDYLGTPYLLIDITNTGRTDANYAWIWIHIYAHKNGNIIDSSQQLVMGLRPGETEVIKANLYNLNSHDDYKSIEINIKIDML